jgi:hypothetical protein
MALSSLDKTNPLMFICPDETVIQTKLFSQTSWKLALKTCSLPWLSIMSMHSATKLHTFTPVPWVCKLSTTHKGKKEMLVVSRCIACNHMLESLVGHT